VIESIGKDSTIRKLSYNIFVHVRKFQWRQLCMYMVLLKERRIHLGKHVVTGSYNNTCFSRFSFNVYSLSGTFSLLQEP
jgi:hypothetical protein